jgi:hypothetical protein
MLHDFRRCGPWRAIALSSWLILLAPRPAAAWGCEGHQAIAQLAERLLDPATRAAVTAMLAAAPIDPSLDRYCKGAGDDPIVNASTWADDERAVAPATAAWHFIDVPRSADLLHLNYRRFCPNGDCLVDALVGQFARIRSSRDPAARAEALRYVIHLVGDAHQPMHTITNGDRGGNCLPVRYYSRAPKESTPDRFFPNLHAVWDGSIIRTLMYRHKLKTPAALADYLFNAHHPAMATARTPTTTIVVGWAVAATRVAREAAYSDLPVAVPVEEAPALDSCAENHDVGHRLAALHESIGRAYETKTIPLVEQQLVAAAVHLAETLRAVVKSGAHGAPANGAERAAKGERAK